MNDGWFQRLVELIDADGRSYRELSRDAKCGPNFVQQMIKDGKDPRASQLNRLFEALGPGADVYVMSGLRLSPEGLEFLRVVSALDDGARRDAFAVLKRMEGSSSEQEQLPSERAGEPSTADTAQ